MLEELMGILSAKFANKIVHDKKWINVYVHNAVDHYLGERTYGEVFVPAIQQVGRRPKEKDFVKQISDVAKRNYGHDQNVRKVINSVTRYLQFEAKKERLLPIDIGFYNNLAFVLLGRYFFFQAKDMGRI